MARYKYITILLLFWSFITSGQSIFLLEKPGTIRNYKYFIGDPLELRIKNDSISMRYIGYLYVVADSSIWLDVSPELRLNDISNIYRERRLVRLGQMVCLIMGAGYICLDSFNRLINKSAPVVDVRTLKTGGIIMGCSLVFYPFNEKTFRIGERWRVKPLISD